jgi:mono/diheme cytochrome c family protein
VAGWHSTLSRLLLVIAAALSLTACRQDMQDQPKYKYLRGTQFFPDGRSARPLVENTVARGQLQEDSVFYTGMVQTPRGPEPTTEFPIEVNRQLIDRGQERFNIFCSPCHGQLGNGLGMIVQRGFKQPPTYHSDRLRQIGVGHFFDVMTNGYGAMWKYSAQVEPRDRWAIAAYIRVLQASQNTNVNDLPAEDRSKLPAAQAMAAITPPPTTPAPSTKTGAQR